MTAAADLDGRAAPGQSPAITPDHGAGFETRPGPLRPQ
jgi:hypothetical protein